MHYCSHVKIHIVKSDKFSKFICPQNDSGRTQMQAISYSSIVGNLIYAQVFTQSDIAYVIGVLERYLSNSGLVHWKFIKKKYLDICRAQKI